MTETEFIYWTFKPQYGGLKLGHQRGIRGPGVYSILHRVLMSFESEFAGRQKHAIGVNSGTKLRCSINLRSVSDREDEGSPAPFKA